MPDTKLPALATPTGGLAAADLLYTVDVSDTTDSAAGSSRRTTVADLVAPVAATQADQETGTSTTVVVTPGRQQFHPSAAKAWARCTVSGGVVTVQASRNITSVTRSSAGSFTVNWDTDFSSANYAVNVTCDNAGSNGNAVGSPTSRAAGSMSFVVVTTLGGGGTPLDPPGFDVAAFGDQ